MRHEILIAASRLFCDHGYAGTQLNQIAEAAGLRTPSLYHYFANKDEILQALLAHANEESVRFADEILNRKGRAAEKLRTLLVKYIHSQTSGPYQLWFLVSAAPRAVPTTEFGRRYARLARAIMKLIDLAVKEGDFDPIDRRFGLHMVFGGVVGAMNSYHFDGISAPEQAADFIIRSLARRRSRSKRRLDSQAAE